MASPNYTRSNLQDYIVDPLKANNITSDVTLANILNRTARAVISEIDLRSTKRLAQISPKLFDDEYSYTCPTDIKGDAIIDIQPQANRNFDTRIRVVSQAEFDLKKEYDKNLVSFADDDYSRRLLYSGNVEDTQLVAAEFDSLTEDGTWSAYNDATNVVADTDNYISGGGSIKFDLTGSATTAGIQNTTLTALDISDYTNNGSIFVWVYINSTTNLTNWILDIGNDLTTNYYTQTITTDHAGNSFTTGWNLLRFDFASMTENGTVTDASVDSVRIYMTKSSGKNDDGYRVDKLVLHTGEYHNILYYTRCPWQTSANVYIIDSTTTADYINADPDELELFVKRGKAELHKELKEFDIAKMWMQDYQIEKAKYETNNPSQRARRNDYYYQIR